MRHRHNGHPPVYTYADQVNNSLHNLKLYKAKTKDGGEAKNVRNGQNIQKENEDSNQTIKSLQFCEMKRHRRESVEEWIKTVRLASNECDYQEQDRQVREQFIYGINDIQNIDKLGLISINFSTKHRQVSEEDSRDSRDKSESPRQTEGSKCELFKGEKEEAGTENTQDTNNTNPMVMGNNNKELIAETKDNDCIDFPFRIVK